MNFPAVVGKEFDFGLRGGHVADLFGGGAEDLSQRFFAEVEIGFGEFGEAFVYFFFDGSDKGAFVGGFKEEIGKEFLVVFFEFGETKAELGQLGGREAFQFGFELLDGGGSHGGELMWVVFKKFCIFGMKRPGVLVPILSYHLSK